MDAFFDNLPRILQLDILLRVLLQLMLFSASAFFSGSETALFSLTRFDLQNLARTKSPVAESLHGLLEQPRRLIVSILCGNELVNIAAAANMTALLAALLGIEAAAWAATFVMIPLILLLGEVTPKTLAVTNPVWASTRIVVKPISLWVRIVSPLAFLVRVVADRTTTLIVGPERTRENILHIEDLQTLLDAGIESGEITPTERTLVNSLITAGSTEVREIMTPRSQVGFIDGSIGNAAVREAFLAIRRARVPVYIGNRDNVTGFLHVEDMLDWDASADQGTDLSGMLHPSIAVSPTKEVDEMLDFFSERDARAALVVDEFGSVDGVVTLSDVTNFLFSGLFEAASAEQANVVPVEGGFEMDGSTSVRVVRRMTGLYLSDTLMTTIAGVALRQFGFVPAVGDRVQFDGLVLEVLQMDGLRIARVRLSAAGAMEQDAEMSRDD
jgi:putative hemolysin